MHKNKKPAIIGVLLAVSLLYAISMKNYLLFHSAVEVFSVVIACGIFMIAWNTRRYANSSYLLFLGIAYLFVASADLLHTLAYKGMGVFPGNGANAATQLWIMARYMESISLLVAPIFIDKRTINPVWTITGYCCATGLLLASIFFVPVFPDCYREGAGLTDFKRISELVIIVLLFCAVIHVRRYKTHFLPIIYRFLIFSILLTIMAELAFIFYVNVYGISNMVGHIFKFFSFYLLYEAMIRMSLIRPYDVLFDDLRQRETRLKNSNQELMHEIEKRRLAENQLREINRDLSAVKCNLESRLSEAFRKRSELTQKISELALKKADSTQSHVKMLSRLDMAEKENRELRRQLADYFEALEKANREIAVIYQNRFLDCH